MATKFWGVPTTTGAVAVLISALIAVTLACQSKIFPANTPRPTPTSTPTPTPTPTPMPPATANIFVMSVSPEDPGMTSWYNATEECQSVGLRLPSSISSRRQERITQFLLSLPADYPDPIQLWRGRASNESETTCRSVNRTRSTNETSFEQLQGCSDSLHGFMCEGAINLSNVTNIGMIGCTEAACALFFE